MAVMSTSATPLYQRSHISHTADVTETFRQTTAEPHSTEKSAIYEHDRVTTAVNLKCLPLAHVHPA